MGNKVLRRNSENKFTIYGFLFRLTEEINNFVLLQTQFIIILEM